jgi:hypothetical protein
LLVDFPFQELIDVDSEVVFELASYILQVSCSTQKKKKKGKNTHQAQAVAITTLSS